jgi:hypothetical protein
MKSISTLVVGIGFIGLMAITVYATDIQSTAVCGRAAHPAAGHADEHHHSYGFPYGGESYDPVKPWQEPITEDDAKTVVKTFLATYLPEYVIDAIEKSGTGLTYCVTIKGFFEDAVLQIEIDAYAGNILYISVPQSVEESIDAITSASS